jgi:hypothetical protein
MSQSFFGPCYVASTDSGQFNAFLVEVEIDNTYYSSPAGKIRLEDLVRGTGKLKAVTNKYVSSFYGMFIDNTTNKLSILSE